MTFSITRRGLAGIAAGAGMDAGFLVKSAQADTLDETLKNNVIRVGINPNSPPFSSRDSSGAWVGFDIDVANLEPAHGVAEGLSGDRVLDPHLFEQQQVGGQLQAVGHAMVEFAALRAPVAWSPMALGEGLADRILTCWIPHARLRTLGPPNAVPAFNH